MNLSEGNQNLNILSDSINYSRNMSGNSSILQNYSEQVQRRISALKKNQLEIIDLEYKFYSRIHEIEAEFQPLFNAVYEKRKQVVTGEYEPLDSECDMPLIHGLEQKELDKIKNSAPVEDKPSKGIPNFWLNVLQNSTRNMIFKNDEPILCYLNDIRLEIHTDPHGFSLYFYFDENPYFTNDVLKKYYELNMKYEEDDPFQYDGPTIVKTEGTLIYWKDNMNVTEKIKKTKKKYGQAAGQFSIKIVKKKSFFNFFDPDLKDLSNYDDDDENQNLLREDFEIGQLIRDRIIQRAVLFITGEASDDDEFSGEDGESFNNDDDNEDD